MAHSAIRIFPGFLAAMAVAAAAFFIGSAQIAVTGHVWLDALVAAIVLGTALHTGFGLAPRLRSGVQFASRLPLEIAIVLLGASVSLQVIGGSGGAVVCTIAALVLFALLAGYVCGRVFGLPPRITLLVSCGNAICGNSAIAAAAPVIGARPDEVAVSIAFTAALGVVTVVALPLIGILLGLADARYGFLTGMLVYAVPQVLAATATAGAVAVQTATLVKLTRVLMLGPVLFVLSLRGRGDGRRTPFRRIVPWFVVGFAAMMVLRSFGLIAESLLPWMRETATVLTMISMAALGLEVDLRDVFSAGGRVMAAGAMALTAIAVASIAALSLLPLG